MAIFNSYVNVYQRVIGVIIQWFNEHLHKGWWYSREHYTIPRVTPGHGVLPKSSGDGAHFDDFWWLKSNSLQIYVGMLSTYPPSEQFFASFDNPKTNHVLCWSWPDRK